MSTIHSMVELSLLMLQLVLFELKIKFPFGAGETIVVKTFFEEWLWDLVCA